MKHLLNNMTEAEKNAIREQHTGGMKVMVENYRKLVGTKLGDVRPITEQSVYNENSDDKRMRSVYECAGLKYNPDGEQAHLFETHPFLNSLLEATKIFLPTADWNEDAMVKAFESVTKQELMQTEKILRCIFQKLQISIGTQNPYIYLAKKAFTNIFGSDFRDNTNKERVQTMLTSFGIKEKI